VVIQLCTFLTFPFRSFRFYYLGKVCRVDEGERIGQVAQSLYAKWRISGSRVEGRPPRSRQRLRFALPQGFRSGVVADVLRAFRFPLSARGDGGAARRTSAASATGASVAKSGRRRYAYHIAG
jgi:hypothetical protein